MKKGTEKLNYFNPIHAVKYGINEAILLNYFQFWITKNRLNKKNLIEGKTWTYISREDIITDYLPFFSHQNIRTAVKNLIAHGVIMKGNFNQRKYDKTNWFAFINENEFVLDKKALVNTNQRIGEYQPIDELKLTNGLANTNQPIPVKKTFKEKVNKSVNELPEIEISPSEDDYPWDNQFENYNDYSGYSTDELNEEGINPQAKEDNSTEGLKTSNKQNKTNTIHMETNNQNKKMNINTKNEMNPGTVHYSKPIEVRPIEILLTLPSTELSGEEKKLRNEYNSKLVKDKMERKQKIVDFYVNELNEKVDRYKFQLIEDIEKIVQSVYIKTNIDGLEEQHKDLTSTLNSMVMDYCNSYSIEVD